MEDDLQALSEMVSPSKTAVPSAIQQEVANAVGLRATFQDLLVKLYECSSEEPSEEATNRAYFEALSRCSSAGAER